MSSRDQYLVILNLYVNDMSCMIQHISDVCVCVSHMSYHPMYFPDAIWHVVCLFEALPRLTSTPVLNCTLNQSCFQK